MPLANNKFLDQLTKITEQHLSDEKFGVSELAKEVGISRVELYRRIKAVSNLSASKFISEIRLKKGHLLLEQNAGNVSEIAYRVGFGSPSYFIKCFREKFGYPPGEVQDGNHTIQEKEPEAPQKKHKISWAVLLIFLVLIISVSTYFIAFNNNGDDLITIAVLPPKDYSPEGAHCLILEGFREDLQSKLYSINELQVVSGTTTDTYRNSDKTIQQIGKELNADYVIEIRGQYADSVNTIWVQLIDAKTDKHVWVQTYNRGLEDERVNEIQQEIALSVASSLKISLSDQEIESIEKLPTINQAAYSQYRLGRNFLENFLITFDWNQLFDAKRCFEKAVELDTVFADAYYQLAEIYITHLTFINNLNYYEHLDSGLLCIQKALNNHTGFQHNALRLQQNYYSKKGDYMKALASFEKLWENKPKDYSYYAEKSAFNENTGDLYNIIKNVLLYLKLKPESVAPDLRTIYRLWAAFMNSGFPELANEYNLMQFQIDNDTAFLKHHQAFGYFYNREYEKAIEIRQELYSSKPPFWIWNLDQLWFSYYHIRDFENARKYAEEYVDVMRELNNVEEKNAVIGSVYLHFGDTAKANRHIEGTFEWCQQAIKENLPFAQGKTVYGLLAGIYSMRGEKEKALSYLGERFAQPLTTVSCLAVYQIEDMSMYDNIREEPEYQEILNLLNEKYQKEHERIKQLLIQEGFTPE